MEQLANEALDAMDVVREKLDAILDKCAEIEGSEDIASNINDNASTFVKANTILEGILSDIEDLE